MIQILPRFLTKEGNWAAKVESRMKNKKRFLNIFCLKFPQNENVQIRT